MCVHVPFQIEFRVEEIMYDTYMASEDGEHSPKYQELVQGRADCASKIDITYVSRNK